MARASLAELEAFATVARRGGFRAAARELGVSSSGLSHAIAALEERLNLRLFNRTTRSVVLTAAGAQFLEEIVPALAAIDGAIENAGRHLGEPSGLLRLNMAAGAAHFVMAPLIRDYLSRFPRMQVEIVSEAALIDVIGKGFDAGVRLLDAVPPGMIAACCRVWSSGSVRKSPTCQPVTPNSSRSPRSWPTSSTKRPGCSRRRSVIQHQLCPAL